MKAPLFMFLTSAKVIVLSHTQSNFSGSLTCRYLFFFIRPKGKVITTPGTRRMVTLIVWQLIICRPCRSIRAKYRIGMVFIGIASLPFPVAPGSIENKWFIRLPFHQKRESGGILFLHRYPMQITAGYDSLSLNLFSNIC